MDHTDHIVDNLRNFVMSLIDLVFSGIGAVETWLREQLSHLGIQGQLQSAVLVVVALLLLFAAIRLVGGLVRIVIVILLALLVIHAVAPLMHA